MSVARHIPNLLSSLRMAAAPLLIGLAETGHRHGFVILMIAAFASDALDGIIARRFGFVSRIGSLLDSIADVLLFSAIAFGIMHFDPAVVASHLALFLCILAAWLGVGILGFCRYGRLASFHTILTRASAVSLGVFAVTLILFGLVPWLLWLCAGLVVISQAEELVLLGLVRRWTPDIPGLFWCGNKLKADDPA